jgi:hypothetical protein
MIPAPRRGLAVALLALAACGGGERASAPAPVPPPAGGGAAAEVAASYRASARLAGGALELSLEPTRPDVHVQAEFPLRATLRASAGVALPRATLGHADAVDPRARGRRWSVPAAAAGGGERRVDVALRFAVCKESEPTWCAVREEQLTASAPAR